ncbi:hypothetical protein F5887DRAFT_1074499 [Amanita rubescens]|nr:hypothetical protein F5887DRAFT_1074499 [Amanita rubescens]
MRPVTGPLQTGTYISEIVETPGKYSTVNSEQSKFTFTKDSRSDAAKWFVESMGNDIYRVVGKDPNMAPVHDPTRNTVAMSKGPAEWRIKETDVPGEYRSSAVSLLTFIFNETWLAADPSGAQTYTHMLK